jgi:hypothetical protein
MKRYCMRLGLHSTPKTALHAERYCSNQMEPCTPPRIRERQWLLPHPWWKEATGPILHNFTGQNGDGVDPSAGLTLASGGELYGTTSNGGSAGFGTVFRSRRISCADDCIRLRAGGEILQAFVRRTSEQRRLQAQPEAPCGFAFSPSCSNVVHPPPGLGDPSPRLFSPSPRS